MDSITTASNRAFEEWVIDVAGRSPRFEAVPRSALPTTPNAPLQSKTAQEWSSFIFGPETEASVLQKFEALMTKKDELDSAALEVHPECALMLYIQSDIYDQCINSQDIAFTFAGSTPLCYGCAIYVWSHNSIPVGSSGKMKVSVVQRPGLSCPRWRMPQSTEKMLGTQEDFNDKYHKRCITGIMNIMKG